MVHPPLGMHERRVLECLRSINQKTLKEITAEYNRKYPPSWINRKIGIKVKEQEIKPILDRLVLWEVVGKQLLSFYDRPLHVPKHFYFLLPLGIQELNVRT